MFRTVSMAAALIGLFTASSVQACSVPVFRYALEQWRPDTYEVVVFHQGPLSDTERELAAKIEPRDLDAAYTANAWVKLVDLDGEPEAELLQLWEQQKTQTLPWMLVRSPAKFGKPLDVVSQEFNEENVTSLLDSPLRKKITQSILKGTSVVWVLLECGDKNQDEAAAEIIEGELKRLQGEIKLPEIDEKDIQDGFLSVDPDELKLQFSMVRVSRDDSQEQPFVQMLLTVDPALRDPEFVNQPMALPVFGRGRALYALIGKGINAETLEDANRFLAGACQCTVKAQNPGVDLLTSVDWDSLVVPTLEKDTILPSLTGLSGFGKPADEEDSADTEANKEEEENAAQDVGKTVASTDDSADSVSEESAVAASASAHGSGSSTASGSTPALSVGRLAIYVVGGLALVVVGLSVLFAPKPS